MFVCRVTIIINHLLHLCRAFLKAYSERFLMTIKSQDLGLTSYLKDVNEVFAFARNV